MATRPTSARWPWSRHSAASAVVAASSLVAEVDGRRRAVAQQRRHEIGPHRRGERRVGVAGLQRERVVEQPLLQRQVEARAQLRPLRGVDVQVDQARQQHLGRAELDDGRRASTSAAPAGEERGSTAVMAPEPSTPTTTSTRCSNVVAGRRLHHVADHRHGDRRARRGQAMLRSNGTPRAAGVRLLRPRMTSATSVTRTGRARNTSYGMPGVGALDAQLHGVAQPEQERADGARQRPPPGEHDEGQGDPAPPGGDVLDEQAERPADQHGATERGQRRADDRRQVAGAADVVAEGVGGHRRLADGGDDEPGDACCAARPSRAASTTRVRAISGGIPIRSMRGGFWPMRERPLVDEARRRRRPGS